MFKALILQAQHNLSDAKMEFMIRDPLCRTNQGQIAGFCGCSDRAYDADWLRQMVGEQGAWANIPPKINRKDPICFSPHLYKARNCIKRFFNKLKYFRRIATRYDKLGSYFLAMIKLAAIRITLRIYESTA